MAAVHIARDLPCIQCGYNLRGLPVDHVCPECGKPTADTVEFAPSEDFPEADDIRHDRRAKRFLPAAALAGCSVDGVMFVADAVRAAVSMATRRNGHLTHVDAREVCEGFRAHACWYFNDPTEAKELLAEWGVHSSEDVGRIVFALVQTGLLTSRPEDDPKDFNGLFTLDSLFS